MSKIKRLLCFAVTAVLLAAALPVSAAGESIYDGVGYVSLTKYNVTNACDGLSMSLDASSADKYYLKFNVSIKNYSDMTCNYGAGFVLEREIGGKYYTLPQSTEVPATGYVLRPGKSDVLSVTLTNENGFYGSYGVLQPGGYRLVKPMYNSRNNSSCALAAYFTVTDDVRLYVTDSVTLRTGAGSGYSLVSGGNLNEGDTVTYMGETGNWTMVRAANGKTGYVYSSYLVGKATPVGKYFYISSPVYLRKGAGTEYSVSRELAAGEKVTFLGAVDEWALIRTANGITGYVRLTYLSEKAESSVDVPMADYLYTTEPVNLRTGPGTNYSLIRELAAGEKVLYNGESGRWTMVKTTSGEVGYVSSAYLSETAPASGSKYLYVTRPVNIRTGPGTNYSLVIKDGLAKGERVTYIETSGRWTLVRTSSGEVGYISSVYLTSTATSTEGTYLYATTAVNLRTGPGTRYATVRKKGLVRGERVTYISTSGRWTMVKTSSGEVGYVYSKYLVAR